MVDFRGISPARQPQAIHTVPDTMPKTQSIFSVFIFSPFAHEFYSLPHSEQHTVGNDTYSIIHSALNFISFPPLFFKHIHCRHSYSAPHKRYKAQKYMQVLFLFKLRSQTYNNSNTHTKHTNMLRNKILKSVTDTWSNAHMIPNKTTLNKLLPAGRGKKWRQQDLNRKKRFIWCLFLEKMELEMGWFRKGLRLGASNLLSHWRETEGWEAQNGKYFKMIGDINKRFPLIPTF